MTASRCPHGLSMMRYCEQCAAVVEYVATTRCPTAPFVEQPFEPEWFKTRKPDLSKAAWFSFHRRRNTPFPGIDFDAWLFPRLTRFLRHFHPSHHGWR